MDVKLLHPWTTAIDEAVRIQRELRDRVDLHAPPDFSPGLVAGADVSMSRDSPLGYAGFVIIDLRTMETIAATTAITPLTFPYVPGLLSFRELPVLIEAWRQLTVRPDVVILDGHGTAHPRRLGIACHAGLIFDVPTVGCAKSILVGRHAPLAEERGAQAPLIDHGEVVGMALRTRTGVAPVYVSPGHYMDLATAVELVLRLTPDGKYRQPETTRRAHRLVNDVRIAQQ